MLDQVANEEGHDMDGEITRIIKQIDNALEQVAKRAHQLDPDQSVAYQQLIGETRGLERAKRIIEGIC